MSFRGRAPAWNPIVKPPPGRTRAQRVARSASRRLRRIHAAPVHACRRRWIEPQSGINVCHPWRAPLAPPPVLAFSAPAGTIGSSCGAAHVPVHGTRQDRARLRQAAAKRVPGPRPRGAPNRVHRVDVREKQGGQATDHRCSSLGDTTSGPRRSKVTRAFEQEFSLADHGARENGDVLRLGMGLLWQRVRQHRPRSVSGRSGTGAKPAHVARTDGYPNPWRCFSTIITNGRFDMGRTALANPAAPARCAPGNPR